MGPKSENVKISSAWIRPKWAYKQQTHIFPTYFACPKEALARQESEPKRQRNDRSEKMPSKEALSDPFRNPKNKIFLLKMDCVYIQNCVSYEGGEHIFRKVGEKVVGK